MCVRLCQIRARGLSPLTLSLRRFLIPADENNIPSRWRLNKRADEMTSWENGVIREAYCAPLARCNSLRAARRDCNAAEVSHARGLSKV